MLRAEADDGKSGVIPPLIGKEGTMERIVEILRQVAEAQGVTLPAETESLTDTGVLDSFGLLEFLTALEEEFEMKIPDDDLVPAKFDTIAKIRAYINGRFGG
jgi:acyl carrier protein